MDRVRLLGHVDDAHPTLADLFQQLVGVDDRTGDLGRLALFRGHRRKDVAFRRVAGPGEGLEQTLDLPAQPRIVAARIGQVTLTVDWGIQFERMREYRLHFQRGLAHGRAPSRLGRCAGRSISMSMGTSRHW